MTEPPGPPGQPSMVWLTNVYDPVTPFMDGLHDCVCREFALAGRAVCHCAQYAGDSPPPFDDCACDCSVTVVDPETGQEVQTSGRGQAWTRLVEVPGESYNRRLASTSGSATGWGACVTEQPFRLIFEVGVARCISVPDNQGYPPSEQDQIRDARELHRDIAVLWRIFECCEVMRRHGASPELDRIEPLGPAGGCVGATMRIWLELPSPEPEQPEPEFGLGMRW